MGRMAKRKNTSGEGGPDEGKPKKRYPSREKTRYVALPRDLYAVLEQYAKSRSDEDDQKSVSWAARVAVRRFLSGEGLWPPPEKGGDEPRPKGG
jgi:hypothetical protein